ncbi:glycine betaine ABC transporter substrate-binding protein [Bacillus sp. AFS031507]|uniref:ABC transporter substrate-binding protein n=1 Tax=Bacillus sp. AFS031507 TaxID=2033496 RepID=UPI000BFE2281|nr:glycine betaine ABC transporter substrate-binding protein [Bacillus sp. AFS031507]PGY09654.1 glycine/betaine ABC transporter substrate-binding protein [Bacillus sp. AFS031507]
MKKIWLMIISIFIVLLAACSSNSSQTSGGSKEKLDLVVASKNFTEQYLLAQIMGQLLQNKTDHNITIKEGGFATSAVLNQGLKDGDLQVVADYTGTGYMNVLKNTLQPNDTPESVYEKTKKGYEKELGLTWLKPFGFNNTFTLVMKEDMAKKLNIKTYSDLVPHADKLVIGMDPAFYDRVDGYKPLAKMYGFKFKDHKEMDMALGFSAAAEGNIDVYITYITAGNIPALHLVPLKDDKGYFPPYFAAPIVSKDLVKKHPEIADVLNQLSGKLDDKTMAELNAKVDEDKKNTTDVAKEFLEKNGLINK